MQSQKNIEMEDLEIEEPSSQRDSSHCQFMDIEYVKFIFLNVRLKLND